ncbi:polysaccharide lyase, putative [Phytophthora infestans T30-4]|uniref:Probable pectate lyase F n=1 Tax=Phytophthora infestans (strain T30-4) TaxID=403677 RepID=D0NT10_PHYIT|nr:polysaccharide lyase, putative [Phytophthora infestans T30-4]EEY64722.1 polysaccharide lyase, putative [Phytophthora infestans T30-4]|eukprot:XP_002897922.1 polysaccharide lyase, putative [Phytophthora infestans T30-4]
MVKSFAPFVTSAALLLAVATSASLPNGSWPASKGTVQYSKAYVVKAGEVFDGKMKTFERSDVSCEGQSESGADTAVFNVEAGGHLKNVIIGKNQMEGVHCDKHDCIIENVWWDDVCEDALSVKGGTASSVTKVIGGGARYADDKVIQHNGFGTVDIDGFYGEDISKLYRSCGTCGNRPKKVSVSNTYVLNPTNAIVTVNKNWGDQATLRNVWVKSSKPTVKVCQWSQGNANGEPKMLGHGPSNPLCKYSESDVHINEDISEAATTPSNTTASVPDGTWPASTGIVRYKKPYTIKAGEVFDGKMQTFERSDITCSGGEGQKDTAVFLVEAGGTLKNAIIGKNQKEGVHCDYHDCTIENVWWDDVCEDALSIKGGSASSVTTVTNCGARYAEDKVVQHNGYGTVKIKGFFAQEFGRLYRSCGTCGNIPRKVTVENVYAIDPLVSVVTVNKNNNDQATLKNIFVKTTDGKKNVKVCQWSQASKTPSNVGDGPSGKLCQYSTSDVHINED